MTAPDYDAEAARLDREADIPLIAAALRRAHAAGLREAAEIAADLRERELADLRDARDLIRARAAEVERA